MAMLFRQTVRLVVRAQVPKRNAGREGKTPALSIDDNAVSKDFVFPTPRVVEARVVGRERMEDSTGLLFRVKIAIAPAKPTSNRINKLEDAVGRGYGIG